MRGRDNTDEPNSKNRTSRSQRPTRPGETSRRKFLEAGTAILAGATGGGTLSSSAFAQGAGGPNSDPELSRLQAARRTLLKGGIVLSFDRAVGNFAQADVLIEDGRIREVRPNIAIGGDVAAVVDASERIVIPGFVDTHSHSFEGLLRSSLPNGTIFDPGYRETFEDKLITSYRPDDVYAGVLVTALGMIEMGTTAMVDTSQINHSPEHSDALVQALQDAGIRAVCAYSRGRGPSSQYPQDVMRLRRSYFNSEDQLLTLAFATSVDPKTFAFAREHGLRSVLHIRLNSEALVALGRAGLMQEADEYIHCTHLDDAAWRMIKDTGGRTSHAPGLEMAMGHGMPSIQDALDHGLRPSLSSDHTKIVAQDMFGMMRAVFDLQRLMILQRAQNGEQSLPPLVTPRDVLEFATVEGARCANLDGRIGTLSPGKEADLLVLRADGLDLWPRSNAYGTVANLMNPGHVEAVFIGGKVKKWRGRLVGIDLARVRRLAAQSREAVMERAGFKIGLLD
jgi:5-methylthioadenosine/S-adenosylhomocysteine deaminase